jgi:hypothetical protein
MAPPVIYTTFEGQTINFFNEVLSNPGSYSLKVSFRCEGDQSPFLNVSGM